MPHNIRPMWVEQQQLAFDRPGWVFEVKYDGYRAVAEIDGDDLAFYSRRTKAMAFRYPQIVAGLSEVTVSQCVLDGEIVALDTDGKPDFEALRHYSFSNPPPIRYMVFDLLYIDGYDICPLPLVQRKAILRDVLASVESPTVGYVDHLEEEGKAFFRGIQALGLEGMVAKKGDSPYRADDGTRKTRLREWIKVKHYYRRGWDETVIRT